MHPVSVLTESGYIAQQYVWCTSATASLMEKDFNRKMIPHTINEINELEKKQQQ